jgi:calcium-dependent protein kinase
MLAIGMDKDEETEDCSSIKSYKPLVIKYSDFLSACIDERKVLTKEKVLANIFSYFLCSNILIIEI